MANLETFKHPFRFRAVVSARAGLVAGGLAFAFCAMLATLVAQSAGIPPGPGLLSLGRQGYPFAWILNFGLALWGGAIFLVALTLRDPRGLCRLGALLLGAGLLALALWSAPPLVGEAAGSQIETRLHAVYKAMGLVGLILCCAAQGLRVSHAGHWDLLSLAGLYGVLVGVSTVIFVPSFAPMLEVMLAVFCAVWTSLRLPMARPRYL